MNIKKTSLKNLLVLFLEFFATFTLTVVAFNQGSNAFPAFAVLVFMVFALGPITGGHLNPAVTLAMWARKSIATKDAISYMVAQVLGAIGGGIMSTVLIQLSSAQSINLKLDAAKASVMFLKETNLPLFPALFSEFLFTFILCLVVILVATTKRARNNQYYALAIGAVVLAGGFSLGGRFSGGLFNPAVSIGAMVTNISALKEMMSSGGLYLLTQLLAGFGAGILGKVIIDNLDTVEECDCECDGECCK